MSPIHARHLVFYFLFGILFIIPGVLGSVLPPEANMVIGKRPIRAKIANFCEDTGPITANVALPARETRISPISPMQATIRLLVNNDAHRTQMVNGAIVEVYNTASNTLVTTGTTDALGELYIHGLSYPAQYEVRAARTGYNPASIIVDVLVVTDYRVTLPLAPQSIYWGQISVSVYDQATMNPLQGAAVQTFFPNGTSIGIREFTSITGQAEIVGLPIGSYEVRVACWGYHTQSQNCVLIQNGDSDHLAFYLVPKAIDSITLQNEDRVYSVAADDSANIMVAGTSFHNSSGYDGYISKFNSSGALLWSGHLNGSELDYATDVAVDQEGNIVVAGITRSSDFPTTAGAIKYGADVGDHDLFITKFDATGVILWSTLLGGAEAEFGISSLAIDSLGNILITGRTTSMDFPTKSAYDQVYNDGIDVFLAKISPVGSLIWSTFLGGANNDYSQGDQIEQTIYIDTNEIDVAIDLEDNVIITSATDFSRPFPITDFQLWPTYGSDDIFLSKFSSSGALQWSIGFGGNNTEYGHSVAVDNEGNIIVTGKTLAADFPIKNVIHDSYAAYHGAGDIFLSKFTAMGILSWSMLVGGSNDDRGHSVAVDSTNNIFLTGQTKSHDFPVPNGHDETFGGGISEGDAFLAKFSSAGDPLWSTYLGGGDDDNGAEVTVGAQNEILIVGNTNSSDFPTLNQFPYSFGGPHDGFLAKYDSTGAPLWSTRTLVVTAADTDPDADGLNNFEEFQNGINPYSNDTDDDQMLDYWEVRNGLDPRTDDANEDYDGDGLSNFEEYQRRPRLNVTNPDTDGDGMPDGWEVNNGLLPDVIDAEGDFDLDTLPNLWEYRNGLKANDPGDAGKDSDDDGLSNKEEYDWEVNHGLDPLDPADGEMDAQDRDSDGDGMPDGWEVKHGLNPVDSRDGKKDLDGDMLPNRLEYQLGFNPESPIELIVGILVVATILVGLGGLLLRMRMLNQNAMELGFANRGDKKTASKAGFTSAQERTDAQNCGFLTVDSRNMVKAAGFENASEMVDAWLNTLASIVEEKLDDMVQQLIQQIAAIGTPIRLREVELGVETLIDRITVARKQLKEILVLQQGLISLSQEKGIPQFADLDETELLKHQKNTTSYLQEVELFETEISNTITEKKQWLSPWPRLLKLIQLTEDRMPVDLATIAEVVGCAENQAESLLESLLEENATIGQYDKTKKLYTKGHDLENLLRTYLMLVKEELGEEFV
ncbi:MAG: SBBP repeat-containing protein [Candidatus Thorarchaeota archaeon]